MNTLTSAATTAGLTGILPQRIIQMTANNQADADGVTAWGLTLEEEQRRGQDLDIQYFIINSIAPKTCEELTPAMDQALTRLSSSLIIATGIEPDEIIFGYPEDRIQSPEAALAAPRSSCSC